ncbi:MAG: hypothetical protein ABSC30_02415 [Acidimicrobiales bacterium]
MAGPLNPDAASSLDRELGAVGLAIFPEAIDLLVDCGRILTAAPGQQEILKAADHVVVVARPDTAGLAHALWTIDVVRDLATGTSSVVIVGSGRFRVGEIEQAFQAKSIAVLPFDEGSAAMVCGSPGRTKRFARSDLVVSARRLVDGLLDQSNLDDDHEACPALTDDDSRMAALSTAFSSTFSLEVEALGEQDPGFS